MENNTNTNQPVNTAPDTNKKTKKPLVIPKAAKILIGVTGAAVIVGIIVASIAIPRAKQKAEEERKYRELIDVEMPYDKIFAELDETTLNLYRQFVVGRFIARTSNMDTKGKILFEFDDNGVFYGHSSRCEDDCGTWELVGEEDGTVALITTVPDLKERYVVDFNNNNDITLKAVDGTVMVLEPEERVLGTADAENVKE